MTMRFISMESSKNDFDVIITVKVTTGFWWWKKTRQVRYIGNGTVWHTFPAFVRAPTSVEMVLADMHARSEYFREEGP